MDWLMLAFQHSVSGRFFSLDDLMVFVLFPFLGGGLVLYVIEDIIGLPEWVSFVLAGMSLLAISLTVAPTYDAGVAHTLDRRFGWQVSYQVGRPLSIYWGGWAILLLINA